MKMKIWFLLILISIFVSFLLSFSIFVLDTRKKGLKFNKIKLFAFANVIFLASLSILFFIPHTCCGQSNPLFVLVLFIFIGFIIGRHIYSTRNKIPFARIIGVLDSSILLFIVLYKTVFNCICTLN